MNCALRLTNGYVYALMFDKKWGNCQCNSVVSFMIIISKKITVCHNDKVFIHVNSFLITSCIIKCDYLRSQKRKGRLTSKYFKKILHLLIIFCSEKFLQTAFSTYIMDRFSYETHCNPKFTWILITQFLKNISKGLIKRNRTYVFTRKSVWEIRISCILWRICKYIFIGDNLGVLIFAVLLLILNFKNFL